MLPTGVIFMPDFFLNPVELYKFTETEELKKCNEIIGQYGMVLTDEQIRNLVTGRFEALEQTGRIEFGEGILKKLILTFCDSPYISREYFEETLLELQNLFYHFKNECDNTFTDDELIEYMNLVFNGKAEGSIEYLADISLEELCRTVRMNEYQF